MALLGRPGLGRGLLVVPLVVAAAATAGCGNSEDTVQHFVSRPDLTPPVVKITTPARHTMPGYVFLAPKSHAVQPGPLILDDTGQVVWFRPLNTEGVADFREQVYRGRPVLTWWRGHAEMGVGNGYDVIMDTSYRVVATVHAGNGYAADVHEFLLTPRNTALITVYQRIPYDLSSVGGPKDGKVFDGIVQEVAIPSGKVLFEWHSLPEVGVAESFSKPPPAAQGAKAAPYDYFHVNSVDEDADGNLLVSARNTHTIYKIDRATGKVVWRLGGKRSDFRMGTGTSFGWQHDARWGPGDEISLFDNDADPPLASQSRPMVLHVDQHAMTATLARAYPHPGGLLSGSQGDTQLLPNGNVFVGWGANPNFTEFDHAGRMLFDGHFQSSDGADSYRAYRLSWSGRPSAPPTLALRSDGGGRLTAYASWNGATGVTGWVVLAGPDPEHLRPIAHAAKDGFETAIDLGFLLDRYVAVRAVGAQTRTSPAEPRPSGWFGRFGAGRD